MSDTTKVSHFHSIHATTTDGIEIDLMQYGGNLCVGRAHTSAPFEDTRILEHTPQEVVLQTNTSKQTYRISAGTYWRAYNGSAEPDVIWAGAMEAAQAKLRQDAQEIETKLMSSTPIKLVKRELACAFCPKEEGSRMTNLLHFTEDLRRPGAYVVLPICTSCRDEQMNAKFLEPSSSIDDMTGREIVYPVNEEG